MPKEKLRMRGENRTRALLGCLLVGMVGIWLAAVPVGAQEEPASSPATGETSPAEDVNAAAGGEPQATPAPAQEAGTEAPAQQERQSAIIDFFVKGGIYMWPLLACAVAGLAVILERFFTLHRAKTNTRRLMSAVVSGLKEKGVEGAKEICMNTRGPIAAILHAGLTKVEHGPAAVEKAIENSGAVEMAFLSRGLPVLSSVISVGPMLGFLGTVSGMIHAFEAIAAAEQVSAKVVASGISEALITTLAGLTIAIPAQLAYNYFLARIDGFVIEMEETSVELLDTLADVR